MYFYFCICLQSNGIAKVQFEMLAVVPIILQTSDLSLEEGKRRTGAVVHVRNALA